MYLRIKVPGFLSLAKLYGIIGTCYYYYSLNWIGLCLLARKANYGDKLITNYGNLFSCCFLCQFLSVNLSNIKALLHLKYQANIDRVKFKIDLKHFIAINMSLACYNLNGMTVYMDWVCACVHVNVHACLWVLSAFPCCVGDDVLVVVALGMH